MTRYLGPLVSHQPSDYHPPGIDPGIDEWCHLVSNVDQADLEAYLTDNIATIGCSPANGANVTYVALTSAQRDAALAVGCGVAPSDGKCYAQAFDRVFGKTWETPSGGD